MFFVFTLFQDTVCFGLCLHDALSDTYVLNKCVSCVLFVLCTGNNAANYIHTCILQAILESDPFSITLKDITEAKKLGEDFAKEIGCKDIACLYTKVIVSLKG